MTRAELEARQLAEFRQLVEFAYRRSEYYRSLIDERGIDRNRCLPTDFPILTKQEAMANFDRIVTNPRITLKRVQEFVARSTDPLERLDGEYHVLHTSGTSGKLGYFIFSHDAWVRGTLGTASVRPRRRRVRLAFVGKTHGHVAGASISLQIGQGLTGFSHEVRTFDVGLPMAEIVHQLNEYQPHKLSGYANMLRLLAEAQERGELRIHPVAVGGGGEPLTPEAKRLVERVFGQPVGNSYASCEQLYMGVSLPHRDGLYLMEGDLIFELHEDFVCVTNLFNRVFPMIRYRHDDKLTPVDEPPRPFRRIGEILGRSEQLLEFTNRDGAVDFIHPLVLTAILFPGVRGWQVVLVDSTSFRLRTQTDPSLGDAERAKIHAEVRRHFVELLKSKRMDNVTFEIEEVDSLPVDPKSGKFRLVVKEPVIVAVAP